MQQARAITTTQVAIHDNLLALVERYQNSEFKRPISDHTQMVFDHVMEWLDGWQGEVMLDSCCGVGESTALLAKRFPHARIIGLDKSAARLDKHHAYAGGNENYKVLRADVNDFWRLAASKGCQFSRHYLLYPNPYPKPSQLQKRWHASAVMPALMALANTVEVRSNWLLYLQEFEQSAKCYGFTGRFADVTSSEPMTPFERKYQHSGQSCFSLVLEREL